MLGGYLFFNSDPGFISLCGAASALGGMSVYTYLNLKKPQESVAANKQNLLPPKPKTTVGSEKPDRTFAAESV